MWRFRFEAIAAAQGLSVRHVKVDIGGRSRMRGMINRYVQALYLSPGFSDFGRLSCRYRAHGGLVGPGGNQKTATAQVFLRVCQ